MTTSLVVLDTQEVLKQEVMAQSQPPAGLGVTQSQPPGGQLCHGFHWPATLQLRLCGWHKYNQNIHGKHRYVMMPAVSSPMALEVVFSTTSSATNDARVGIMATLQVSMLHHGCTWVCIFFPNYISQDSKSALDRMMVWHYKREKHCLERWL